MAPYGNLSLGEIVEAAERRAASGEKIHPGFDFSALAPSPLKVAKHEAQLAELGAPASVHAANAKRAVEGIDGDLDDAWSRLKRQINPPAPAS
jgi:hypothetical protein